MATVLPFYLTAECGLQSPIKQCSKMWIIAELKWVTRTWHKAARPYPQQQARCHWNSPWSWHWYSGGNYLCTTSPLLHPAGLSSRGSEIRDPRQGVLCFPPGKKKRFNTWWLKGLTNDPEQWARSCGEQLLCGMGAQAELLASLPWTHGALSWEEGACWPQKALLNTGII